ncbi:MAG: hypothetical protein E6H06_13030 [Bacteroidetes bacterium]|nr:MAG: hypothetical protein E6H06_13030 [Bacteroidota bacterium]
MPHNSRSVLLSVALLLGFSFLSAQTNFKLKYNNSSVYAGIEVGSKGVKMSVIEIGRNAQSRGAFNILKDSSVNTDFISFSEPTFHATLEGICGLYSTLVKQYKIQPRYVFTLVSSGVKIQAEKENKTSWINNLIDSFKLKIKDSERQVSVIDVLEEARLSHLGIVPETRRYNTFLIDIGSGNTKGGYFPNGNTRDFKLFQLSWGTKSTANAAEKRCGDDNGILNFNKQLYRVLSEAENSEIIYAVNESGSYPKSDNVAFSGGISWSVATLMFPELIDNSVVAVTFEQVLKFQERLYNNFSSVSEAALTRNLMDKTLDKDAVAREVKRVHQVFDQKSLMAGTGLLIKIMRQFQSIYEGKQFYLVKNGQVGWISAYVDQTVGK